MCDYLMNAEETEVSSPLTWPKKSRKKETETDDDNVGDCVEEDKGNKNDSKVSDEKDGDKGKSEKDSVRDNEEDVEEQRKRANMSTVNIFRDCEWHSGNFSEKQYASSWKTRSSWSKMKRNWGLGSWRSEKAAEVVSGGIVLKRSITGWKFLLEKNHVLTEKVSMLEKKNRELEEQAKNHRLEKLLEKQRVLEENAHMLEERN